MEMTVLSLLLLNKSRTSKLFSARLRNDHSQKKKKKVKKRKMVLASGILQPGCHMTHVTCYILYLKYIRA